MPAGEVVYIKEFKVCQKSLTKITLGYIEMMDYLYLKIITAIKKTKFGKR